VIAAEVAEVAEIPAAAAAAAAAEVFAAALTGPSFEVE